MEHSIKGVELQLVQVKESICGICVAYHVRGVLFPRVNHMLFVIVERKMFSLVRPSWCSLALGFAYPTVHLVPFFSSSGEQYQGVLQKEFDIVRLMNVEFVSASSEQVAVTVYGSLFLGVAQDFTRHSVHAMEFVETQVSYI
ncbi:hypothetical protein Bca101_021555 [Brassica carinata]